MDIRTEVIRNVLKKVRHLEVRTNRLLDDHFMGSYRSIFKGQGMDFEEVREYAIGDDIRSIDWNITAKMNRPFIKKFREERELTVLLVVDSSASLDFGSVSLSKREILTEISSILAFSANRNNDKVGLLLFSDAIERFTPPAKGRKHILRIIRDILFHEPRSKGTDLIGTMRYLNQMLKKRAIIFLLSDFLQPNLQKMKQLTDALAITHRRHDLVCLRVEDPRERDLSNLGIIIFEDQETGAILEIDTSEQQFQRSYKAEKKRYNDLLNEQLMKMGIDFFEVNTEEHYIEALNQFLKGHAKKR
ncbi:MAG: DUF58 domain-containing protein [Puniceicoccales bacterium]|jgi:uncharacterized protein (DUF58 family)|nr:DUF58 domain-containing protein [Puniceicoccales bacterium]